MGDEAAGVLAGPLFHHPQTQTPAFLNHADPELIRQVCVGKFKAFHDRPGFVNLPKSRSKRLRAIQSGLLVAK